MGGSISSEMFSREVPRGPVRIIPYISSVTTGGKLHEFTKCFVLQGSNSDLSYYIEGGDGLFKVDSNGVISVNGSLDYESNTTFSFKVCWIDNTLLQNHPQRDKKSNCQRHCQSQLRDLNSPPIPVGSIAQYR